MNSKLKEFLFDKHILVNDVVFGEDQVSVLYALKNKFNVEITSGHSLAHPDMIRFCSKELGIYIPEPFYRGFPQTVRELTPSTLLLDQLIHYTRTYGFGDFSESGHSLFERALERSKFNEEDTPKQFTILTEACALMELKGFVQALLDSSRPLNEEMEEVVVTYMAEAKWFPKSIASKETAVELLANTEDIRFARFINLADVLKLVDYINFNNHGKKLNNLKLTSHERKFVTKVLDKLLMFGSDMTVVRSCIEKRDAWKGLLHHIHYVGKTDDACIAIANIYDEDIKSVYSTFERIIGHDTMSREFVAKYLKDHKGNGALLRNLNYILGSCKSCSDIEKVLNQIDAKNPLVLIQLQNQYRTYSDNPRTFKFTKYGKVHTHREFQRKNVLPEMVRNDAITALEDKLEASLEGKVGKVYIAPGMEKIAVPINISASESGFGIMPTGSRIKLPEGKKIRAFTYWEKVNDIDLSCFGIDEDGSRTEFSWRTMWGRQSDAVTYSGDETSGYNGGSEYFDVDFDKVHGMYPNMKYMVFCNNVFSGIDFSECVCRAGWMSRDILNSGEVYEPKTIKSAYTIDARSTYAYLFAVDIEKREVIWLNLVDSKRAAVAGATEFGWLDQYFNACDTMNMRKLFEYAGTVVDTPEEADLVVGDIETDKEQIHSYDFEKAFSYIG